MCIGEFELKQMKELKKKKRETGWRKSRRKWLNHYFVQQENGNEANGPSAHSGHNDTATEDSEDLSTVLLGLWKMLF